MRIEPILRKRALRLIPHLVERAKRVNETELLQHRILKVALFGSVLLNKHKLGDLDVAVQLVAKEGAHDYAAFLARYPIPQDAPDFDRLHWPAVVAKCEMRVHPCVHTTFWEFIEYHDLPRKIIFTGGAGG